MFFGILSDIRGQIEGIEGRVVLSEKNNLLSIAKTVELLTQFVPFEINQKQLISKVISKLGQIAVDEMHYGRTMELLGEIESYFTELAFELTGNIEFTKLGAEGLLKGAGVQFCDDYEQLGEKIIDYKFNNMSYLYRTFLQIILSTESVCNYIKKFDILIPVPIHKKRAKKRGYNQSELIAKGIAKDIKSIQLQTNIIEKIKNIKPQSTLSKDMRIENVKNAYRLKKCDICLKNKNILLIDDVFTTGSTVNECAKILLQTECNKVSIITLAKD